MGIYFARLRESVLSNNQSSVFNVSETFSEEILNKISDIVNEHLQTYSTIEDYGTVPTNKLFNLLDAAAGGIVIEVKGKLQIEKRHLKLIQGSVQLAAIDTMLTMLNETDLDVPSWVREVFEEVKLFLISEDTLDIFHRETDVVDILDYLTFALKKYVATQGDRDSQLTVVPAFLKSVREHIGSGNVELSNELVSVLNNKLLGL